MIPVKPYLLDNSPVTFREIIEAAKREGYGSADGLYTTSAAAAFLRAAGYEVKDNPEYR